MKRKSKGKRELTPSSGTRTPKAECDLLNGLAPPSPGDDGAERVSGPLRDRHRSRVPQPGHLGPPEGQLHRLRHRHDALHGRDGHDGYALALVGLAATIIFTLTAAVLCCAVVSGLVQTRGVYLYRPYLMSFFFSYSLFVISWLVSNTVAMCKADG